MKWDVFFFFFSSRRRHTRFSRDWSSDVCSSDLEALGDVLETSRDCPAGAVVGLPLEVGGLVFNCAAVLHAGRLLGVVPKTYLPNYREFYERRYFASADAVRATAIEICGQTDVAFGAGLVFQAEGQPRLLFHVEVCEDRWAPS